jgi:hypothetical protein
MLKLIVCLFGLVLISSNLNRAALPDNLFLAVPNDPKSINIYKTSGGTATQVTTLNGHDSKVNVVKLINPYNFASASDDKTVVSIIK